jgi:hypothetical protein
MSTRLKERSCFIACVAGRLSGRIESDMSCSQSPVVLPKGTARLSRLFRRKRAWPKRLFLVAGHWLQHRAVVMIGDGAKPRCSAAALLRRWARLSHEEPPN